MGLFYIICDFSVRRNLVIAFNFYYSKRSYIILIILRAYSSYNTILFIIQKQLKHLVTVMCCLLFFKKLLDMFCERSVIRLYLKSKCMRIRWIIKKEAKFLYKHSKEFTITFKNQRNILTILS